ncbi:hypothetical protein FBY40_1486 [Microbacterium sp. SLBN-154]|uniref:DUF6541 family protein n=1 Tax=Microbacterium sp. SLBN-154 TaxID=2768458 RepID=UPI0011544706|nr:DUF6541 family protein [Microbacterium sp. SLBN-154]TQK18995.1 hypothetical protein FBY40_1486 [Microbacterium sp. SLBN-154]
MTWFDLAVASTTAAAIILLPGLGLAAVLGLRGLWAWGMAGPFGVSVVVLASLAAPLVGIPWGFAPVIVVFAIIAVGLVLARLATGGLRRPVIDRAPSRGWWTLLSLAIAALILTAHVCQVVQAPGNISQTFDNIFHLNGIRYALDTANASPLHLGSMTSTSGGVWFYPSAWHAWGSVVMQLTGVDIAVASNALVVVCAAILWPAGAVLLARTVFGTSRSLVISAGVFAAALPSMPLLPMTYGVLYPYQLGLSVMPGALAAALVLLRVCSPLADRTAWVWAVAVLGALPGVVIAHPGAFMAWLVLVSVAVLIAFVGYVRTRPGRRRLAAVSVGFAVYVSVAFIAWRVLRPPLDARSWPPTVTLGQAIGESATLSYWRGAIPVVAVAALVVGLVVCLRRRNPVDIWAVGTFAAASLLYVAAVGFPWPDFRDLLTASWYNNAPRLAAIVPVVIVPLAALGTAAVWRRFSARVFRTAEPDAATGSRVSMWAAASLVLLIVATQLGAVRQAIVEASATYALTAEAALLSADEMTLLRRLADDVPEDAVIAGSPWTGTGLAYAISGRQVLMPHTLMDIDDATAIINDGLNAADRRAAVCGAVRDKGVEYVLDFGDREVHGAENEFPGFERLASSSAVEKLDSVGGAVLYRVTGCEVGG